MADFRAIVWMTGLALAGLVIPFGVVQPHDAQSDEHNHHDHYHHAHVHHHDGHTHSHEHSHSSHEEHPADSDPNHHEWAGSDGEPVPALLTVSVREGRRAAQPNDAGRAVAYDQLAPASCGPAPLDRPPAGSTDQDSLPHLRTIVLLT